MVAASSLTPHLCFAFILDRKSWFVKENCFRWNGTGEYSSMAAVTLIGPA
jgi:hypothetical protein